MSRNASIVCLLKEMVELCGKKSIFCLTLLASFTKMIDGIVLYEARGMREKSGNCLNILGGVLSLITSNMSGESMKLFKILKAHIKSDTDLCLSRVGKPCEFRRRSYTSQVFGIGSFNL